jgi:glutamate synthase domain-containing protein 3
LLFPKSNSDDAVHLESTQSGNFGAKIRKDLPVFSENHKHDINHIDELPEEDIQLYMTELKKIMKLLQTHIVAVDSDKKASVWEKRNSVQKRKQQKTRRFKKNDKRPNPGTDLDDAFAHKDTVGDGNSPPEECKLQTSPPSKNESHASTLLASVPFSSNEVEQHQYYLKQKRFHNFTSNVMAHQYLAYHRLDRLYHRATLELPSETNDTSAHGSKFAVISMSGDMFLTG